MPGMVLTYACAGRRDDHECSTHRAIAEALAALLDFEFGGEYRPGAQAGARRYFLPSDTLLHDEARALGIRSSDDLFGGVVPFGFVATKAIVHPLLDREAAAPQGWSQAFARRVREAVLPGYAAFSARDARRAGAVLLARGPIRLKPGQGVGGHDQAVVTSGTELERALAALDARALERFGLAIELDLDQVTTYSVGQVNVGELRASYCGTQRTTTDNRGATVFGGSDLFVVRGGFDALAALPLAPLERRAVTQARLFDAATAQFAGLFASRRNYDVARGRDGEGRWRCGVLEQSWRIGGASGAEMAALAALRADPALRAVHACCIETYGSTQAPHGAIVHFAGVDSRVGPLTKYALVEPHEAFH